MEFFLEVIKEAVLGSKQTNAEVIVANLVGRDYNNYGLTFFTLFNGNTCQSQLYFVEILEILLYFATKMMDVLLLMETLINLINNCTSLFL